jgi:hypothetical protein
MLGKPTALEDVLNIPRLELFILRRSFEGFVHVGYVVRDGQGAECDAAITSAPCEN